MQTPTHVTLTSTEWLSMPALSLETPTLRVITVPDLGAKIVSLFDRVTEREWLLPPAKGYLQPVEYGAPFTEQDMSGWDEMFPTIDRCSYPVTGHYHNVPLPDHGEVWSLAWTHDEQITDGIRLNVEGRVLPYRLSRTIHIIDDQTVRLSYEAVNLGDETLVALWAAHPQFTADGSTRVALPDGVSQVINVQSTDELPTIEAIYPWPEATTAHGRTLLFDRLRPDEVSRYRKVYLPPNQPVSWAALRQPTESGEETSLHLSWDIDKVPYLGIWIDERAFSPAPTIALEPATGFYDNLALAQDNSRVMHLLPDTPYCWSIDLTFRGS
jgi:galactose mutarotase-like enzyme